MKGKRKKNPANKQTQKRTREDRGYSERVRAKWLCCAFRLGFLQLICKAFQVGFKLALSIILKQKELYESKHVALECRCLKI